MTMYRAKHLAKQGRRPLCVLLALVVLATVFTTLRLPAQAAGAPTSLGLAEHGLMAYRDYQPGATPEARIPEEMIENALN